VDPRNLLGVSEKGKVSLPAGNETAVCGTSSRIVDTTLTELFWLPSSNITNFEWRVCSPETAVEAYEGILLK
jgi:hypothetical protein